MEEAFCVDFISEMPVHKAINRRNIEINGQIKRFVPILRFDGYLEFTESLRRLLGFKWQGIIFEAQDNWHEDLEIFLQMYPKRTVEDWNHHQELDQFKRDICKKEFIILLEIKERCPESKWLKDIIEQIKEQTGIELKERQLNASNTIIY